MDPERRRLLKLMGWGALISLLGGSNCYLTYLLRQSSEQPAGETLTTENWPEIKVSSRVDLGIRVIANIESYQVPPHRTKGNMFFLSSRLSGGGRRHRF